MIEIVWKSSLLALQFSIANLSCNGREELTPSFVRLLKDSEAEVRVAAAGKVSQYCRTLDPQQVLSDHTGPHNNSGSY